MNALRASFGAYIIIPDTNFLKYLPMNTINNILPTVVRKDIETNRFANGSR